MYIGPIIVFGFSGLFLASPFLKKLFFGPYKTPMTSQYGFTGLEGIIIWPYSHAIWALSVIGTLAIGMYSYYECIKYYQPTGDIVLHTFYTLLAEFICYPVVLVSPFILWRISVP